MHGFHIMVGILTSQPFTDPDEQSFTPPHRNAEGLEPSAPFGAILLFAARHSTPRGACWATALPPKRWRL
jgi:hypothetical protein